MTCPACGASGADVAQESPRDFEYDVSPATPYRELRCRRCASEFLSPRPAASDLVGYYPDHYHAYNEDHGAAAGALVKVRARRRGQFYSRLIEGGTGHLFDVGAGDCRHFDSLKSYCDIECAGVEINPGVAAQARARGYDVAAGTLEEFDMSGHAGRYDIVSMYHVIEHVIDPPLVLRNAFDLLRQGGHIVGQTPAVDSWEREIFGVTWGGYHFPRHTQVFSRAGLALALQTAGFADVRVTSAPHVQTAISVQNFLISRGWNPVKTHGKSPIYGLLLIGVIPFEILAYLAGHSGIIDFVAQKP